jgi:hypothetical protein
MASAMDTLGELRGEFMPSHRSLVETAARLPVPVAFCTIYDANMGPHITTAMAIFNDAITRNIHRAALDLIDLRLVCDAKADYANPIEPSVVGGQKIAAAIARYVETIDMRGPGTRVFC